MQAVQIDKSKDFTEGKIFSKLLKLIIPIILTGLLQHLYNASDMIVVGNFSKNGSDAMGGVGSSSALCTLFVGLFIGLSVGAGVISSQNIGAKKYGEVKRIIDTSVVISLVCGIAIGAIVFIGCEPMLELMGTPKENISQAVPYMRAYFMGAPAIVLYNFLAAIVRSSGDTKTPLLILMFSGLVNVLMNLWLVIGFDLGAMGVGIATAISQYVAAILILIYLLKIKNYCKLTFKNFKVHKQIIFNIIKIGVPSGLQTVFFAASNVIIQSAINGYGNFAVNGNTAANNIEGIIYVCLNSIYQGALVFIGQNYGAKRFDRIKKSSIIIVCFDVVFGLSLGLSFCLVGEQLLSIYTSDTAVIEWGIIRIQLICPIYFFVGIMEIGTAFLRGMGKSMQPMIITLLGSCLFRILWVNTICVIFPNDITILFTCYPISWIITSIVLYTYFIFVYKKEKLKLKTDC